MNPTARYIQVMPLFAKLVVDLIAIRDHSPGEVL
jgi:hypothetical protein